MHPTLLQIGAVGVLGYTFYIGTDGKLLQAITVDLQNTDEDLIPDRKTVVGIPDPIPGQVPCHDRALHAEGFDAYCLFRHGNHTGLHGASLIDAVCAGGILIHVKDLPLFEHRFLAACHNGACLLIHALYNEVDLAAQHIAEQLVLAADHFGILCAFEVLFQLHKHFL